MPLLTGFESNQLGLATNAVADAWANGRKVYEDPAIHHERMQYGLLGTIEFLISHIRPTGELDTDAAMKERENETGFNPETYERAVSYLVESWPNIAAVVARVSG